MEMLYALSFFCVFVYLTDCWRNFVSGTVKLKIKSIIGCAAMGLAPFAGNLFGVHCVGYMGTYWFVALICLPLSAITLAIGVFGALLSGKQAKDQEAKWWDDKWEDDK